MLKKFILIIFVLFLAVPTAFADDSSIIPVLWLFAQNGKLQDENLQNVFVNASRIYEYNMNHEKVGYFQPFSTRIYQYNMNHEKIGYFQPFSTRIYQYNMNHEKIGYFQPY